MAHTFFVGHGAWLVHNCGGDYVTDIVDTKVTNHILDGEIYPNGKIGGGHRNGTGIPGKSEFPVSWSDNKILHEISDVVTDPASTFGRIGSNGYQAILGTRGGVEIKAILDTIKSRIVSDYPTNLPRNPQ